MPRSKKRYVVGFDEDHQVVYGKSDVGPEERYTNPMTIGQARRMLREVRGGTTFKIYNLVPVRGKALEGK